MIANPMFQLCAKVLMAPRPRFVIREVVVSDTKKIIGITIFVTTVLRLAFMCRRTIKPLCRQLKIFSISS